VASEYNLPTNQWLLVPEYFRPNCVVPSICLKFAFHHIRPVDWSVELAENSGGYKNETTIIKPNQVSLILGYNPGYFHCVTATSNFLNKNARLLANEYMIYHKLGQAKIWHLWADNLFKGNYEVFNGPNPIDLR
jgi:hypothetical protein